MDSKISQKLKIIPKMPGCYQFLDKNSEIIYIGKAKNLSKRVSSYFRTHKDSPKLQVLTPQICDIKCIAVDNEVEALILEAQLIKKHSPKYNILLKDDKKFPYFLITDEDYPRIIVARKANKNIQKGKYFGPFTDARAMHATLEILQKIFPLKKCKTPKFNSRPCLYYDMGQCLAPCQGYITPVEYKKILGDVELFLNGKQNELIKILKAQMKKSAQKHEYEKAKTYRDGISDIKTTMEKQKVISENKKLNEDYIAVEKSENTYCACILEIREGRLIGKKDFEFRQFANNTEAEVIDAALREYYGLLENMSMVKKIFANVLPDDKNVYENWLSGLFGEKISISLPKTKKQHDIMELASKNAKITLEQSKLKELMDLQNDYNKIGSLLMEKLNLKTFPHTIECYDISHIQGTNTVASRVTFYQGQPKKSLYRRYKLRTLQKGEVDDFKSMREILTRRFKRIKQGYDTAPDLIIIDGGKGQLSSVLTVAKELDLNLNIVSLAKKEEEIFTPNSKKPVIFPLNSAALHLFQRIRDEAHRFAIAYHRSARTKEMLR